jgi:hypothetical protein
MGEIECARRLVVLARAALGCLLRAHKGLGRRAWAIHAVVVSLQWRWGHGQLEAVPVGVAHVAHVVGNVTAAATVVAKAGKEQFSREMTTPAQVPCNTL